jgi:hypothetical protein
MGPLLLLFGSPFPHFRPSDRRKGPFPHIRPWEMDLSSNGPTDESEEINLSDLLGTGKVYFLTFVCRTVGAQ